MTSYDERGKRNGKGDRRSEPGSPTQSEGVDLYVRNKLVKKSWKIGKGDGKVREKVKPVSNLDIYPARKKKKI